MMRRYLAALFAALALAAADDAPKPARVTIEANVIPGDAVKVAPGLYLWTDAKGARWLFQKIEGYGIARMELQPVIVSEKGDIVSFSQLTPFGVMRSERKKTDLNETERRIYDEYLKALAADGRK